MNNGNYETLINSLKEAMDMKLSITILNHNPISGVRVAVGPIIHITSAKWGHTICLSKKDDENTFFLQDDKNVKIIKKGNKNFFYLYEKFNHMSSITIII